MADERIEQAAVDSYHWLVARDQIPLTNSMDAYLQGFEDGADYEVRACPYNAPHGLTSGTARQTVPDDGPGPTPPPGPSSPPDGGVGAPPGPHDPSPDAATSSPTPPSLDDLDLVAFTESTPTPPSPDIREIASQVNWVDPPDDEGWTLMHGDRGRYMDAEEAAECFRAIVTDTDPVRRAIALSSLAAMAGFAVVSPPVVEQLVDVLRALRDRVPTEPNEDHR